MKALEGEKNVPKSRTIGRLVCRYRLMVAHVMVSTCCTEIEGIKPPENGEWRAVIGRENNVGLLEDLFGF